MLLSKVKTKNGDENIIAYDINEVLEQYPALMFRKIQRNHKMIEYSTEYICLDTETSHDNLVRGWIYQWAIKLDRIYCYGRKPTEIIDFMSQTCEYYGLNDNKKIIIYIHNASYDLQYLKHYIYQYDKNARFMAIDSHSILLCDVVGFRFICSYKLTNLSLANLSDNYAEKYRKAVGEIDYNIVRYQDDVLNSEDWYYMFSDVASQYDGIKGYLKVNEYNYACEAPFTSTGFVRAELRKKATQEGDTWRREFNEAALSLEQYNLCRQAFMGGLTIANYLEINKTIRSDKLRHKDFTSSYPARQLMEYFPHGAPSWYGEIDSEDEFQYLLDNYCCVFLLYLEDVHIKHNITAPYIPSSKCIQLEDAAKLNGKIVYAKSLTIAVTELDYKWIKKQYTGKNKKIDKMLIFDRGKLPEWFRKEVFKYFENKCTLKGVDDLLYMKSKNLLNGIYGMTATAIIREHYEMDKEHIFVKKHYTDKEEKENADLKELNKYYKSRNSFLEYQWALWTTAHARDALMTMIETVGYENFLYCDTDSVFYLETETNKINMKKYQEILIEKAIKNNAYVGNKYLGNAEDEPPFISFRALHAKCYALEEFNKKTNNYELAVTIAGIPKKSIKWIDNKPVLKTNAQELGNIDNLKDGFIFSHCGGTRAIYNEDYIKQVQINGHNTELASSVIIDNIEKEVNDTMFTATNNYEILTINQETLCEI